mmetsp:Transcript_22566/g.29547  ORF Transcript_22566/g.29547 Transcript_22566/m.29547 type:complete len:1225 (-) Transcript_22566:245-3919(-)
MQAPNRQTPKRRSGGLKQRRGTSVSLREEEEEERFLGSARRRIFSNLKRKFWDSNEVLSNGAVIVRDLLATVYNSGKDKAASTANQTVELYNTCKAWSSEAEFPRYLVPLRDHVLLPTFHGVEGAVQWVTSDRVPELYAQLKATGARLPLGETIIIPYVNTVENVAGYALMILRAPFPSTETVVYGVESCMELTKRGIGVVARETYFYVQLVDVQITRTLTRAQWDILGYGPYAELSEEGKQLVIDRTCEKYLSLKHPLRRYEFLALIRWHNGPLYQALLVPTVLKERGGLKVEMDLWLNADAPWREGLEQPTKNLPSSLPRRPLSYSANYDENPEVVGHSRIKGIQKVRERSVSHPSPSGQTRKRPLSKTVEEAHPFWYFLDENTQEWLLYPAHENRRLEISFQRFKEFGGLSGCETGLSKSATLGFLRNQSRRDMESMQISVPPYSEPHGCGCGCGCPSLPECFCGLSCVVVDEGRYTVSLREMRQYPVYWRPHGAFVRPRGTRVHRATWMEETKLGLLPYSEGALAILEDAYHFLQWWLAHPIGRHRITASGGFCPSEELIHEVELDDEEVEKVSPGVLLTVQVGSMSPDGLNDSTGAAPGSSLPERSAGSTESSSSGDQLVQFRSLSEIFAVRKTLASAMWAKTRRVYRGTQAIARQQARRKKKNPDKKLVVPGLSQDHLQLCHESLALARGEMPSSLPPHIALRETAHDLEDPVDHLILVVHGIGEALENIDVMGLLTLRSLIDCCEDLRNQHKEVMETCEVFSDQTSPKISPDQSDDETEYFQDLKKTGRVEFLPVEWHSRLHGILKQGDLMSPRRGESPFHSNSSPYDSRSWSSRGDLSESQLLIDDITLPRIPHLRSFLNDTAMDILYFMSPPYHQVIVDEVTKELNRIYQLFCRRTKNFSGKVSIAAHSLGSIICFDILANQPMKEAVQISKRSSPWNKRSLFKRKPIEGEAVFADFLGMGFRPGTVVKANRDGSFNIVYNHGAKEIRVSPNRVRKKMDGIDSTKKKCEPSSLQYSATTYPQLGFKVENMFCMGSPVGMFLMIRNQHRTLDKQYCLPGCQRMFNIFHPYDPVAFRIEPFLTGGRSEDPEIVPTWTGGLRVQYKMKRLKDDMWKSIFSAKKDIEREIEAWFERVGLLEKEDDSEGDGGSSILTNTHEEEVSQNTYGLLAGGLRIDYTLQEKEIEVTNEYIFAITAHVLYWQNKDLSLFMARHLYDT